MVWCGLVLSGSFVGTNLMLQFFCKTSDKLPSDAAGISTLAGWVPALGDGALRRGPIPLARGRVQRMGRTKQPQQDHALCRLAVCLCSLYQQPRLPLALFK